MNDFARDQTLSRLEILARCVDGAAKDASNADAIHDVRVASRRFVQCLKTFASQFDAKALAKVQARMRKLLQRCGAVRNCDVALELLGDVGISKRSPAVKQVSEMRKDAEGKLAEQLKRWAKRDILHDWPKRLFKKGGSKSEGPNLAALTKALFTRGQAAAAAGSTHHQMHRFRLRAKAYRYTVEIFVPRYGDAAIEPVMAGMKELQDRLGEMNDCVSTLELIEGHARAEHAIGRTLAQREQAFRAHWKQHFGTRRRNEWTSIFSATARPSHAQQPGRKRPGNSQRKAAKTSGE